MRNLLQDCEYFKKREDVDKVCAEAEAEKFHEPETWPLQDGPGCWLAPGGPRAVRGALARGPAQEEESFRSVDGPPGHGRAHRPAPEGNVGEAGRNCDDPVGQVRGAQGVLADEGP